MAGVSFTPAPCIGEENLYRCSTSFLCCLGAFFTQQQWSALAAWRLPGQPRSLCVKLDPVEDPAREALCLSWCTASSYIAPKQKAFPFRRYSIVLSMKYRYKSIFTRKILLPAATLCKLGTGSIFPSWVYMERTPFPCPRGIVSFSQMPVTHSLPEWVPEKKPLYTDIPQYVHAGWLCSMRNIGSANPLGSEFSAGGIFV